MRALCWRKISARAHTAPDRCSAEFVAELEAAEKTRQRVMMVAGIVVVGALAVGWYLLH
jgi:hypothetical protein